MHMNPPNYVNPHVLMIQLPLLIRWPAFLCVRKLFRSIGKQLSYNLYVLFVSELEHFYFASWKSTQFSIGIYMTKRIHFNPCNNHKHKNKMEHEHRSSVHTLNLKAQCFSPQKREKKKQLHHRREKWLKNKFLALKSKFEECSKNFMNVMNEESCFFICAYIEKPRRRMFHSKNFRLLSFSTAL